MYNETSSALETTYGTDNINSVNGIAKIVRENPHPTNRMFAYDVKNMPLGTYLNGSVGKTVVAKFSARDSNMWCGDSTAASPTPCNVNCNNFPCIENPANPTQELVYKKLGTLPAWGDSFFDIIHYEENGQIHYSLQTKTSLNYEAHQSVNWDHKFRIQVEVTDCNGCADGLSDIAIVTVNVVNVPENALMPDTLLQIDENSLDGADVGTALQTVDLDFSDEGYIEHIIPGPPYPFYVDMMMQTRIVTLNNVGTTALLDAELKNLYYYKVLIKDFTTLDGPVMASNGKLTVQILNLNESPQISAQLYTYTVMENATVGTLVGSLTAFDPDFDSNLHYSIKSGDKESRFRIVKDNSQPLYAQILTDNVLDYELVQHYALICEVVDESELSTSGIFYVQVIDINDIQVSSVSIVDPTFGRSANYGY